MRNLLAISHFDKFKNWLAVNGWKIQETKGDYEVLRATMAGRRNPLIVYKRTSTTAGNQLAHFTVLDRDLTLVKKFIKESKKK